MRTTDGAVLVVYLVSFLYKLNIDIAEWERVYGLWETVEAYARRIEDNE